MLSEANTKVGGRLGMKRCDPSSCRARSASAVFKTFVLHPKNTFATKSAQNGRHLRPHGCPLPGGILLQKSKIEQPRKSGECRFLVVPAAATLRKTDTAVCGRFCVKGCGPPYRRVRNASAVLKIFGHPPEKTFSTLSGEKRTSQFKAVPDRTLCAYSAAPRSL